MKYTVAALITGAAVVLAAPAAADPDTDFSQELHTYGIYGQKDYNAWIGKLVCKRLNDNVDHNAFDSAKFLGNTLDGNNTTEHNWQFLSAALNYYCPDNRAILAHAAMAGS